MCTPNRVVLLRFAGLIASVFPLSAAARAQCLDGGAWIPMPAGPVHVMVSVASWDPDGPGPQPELIVAGAPTAPYLFAWNGASWSTFAGGTNAQVSTLLVDHHNRLVAGGYFSVAGGVPVSGIAAFDGVQWQPLGTGLRIGQGVGGANALVELPNGDLVAGGGFDIAGDIPASSVARWDGVAWHAMGNGLSWSSPYTNVVRNFHLLADGTLLAVGDIARSGLTPISNVAVWEGAGWASLSVPPLPEFSDLTWPNRTPQEVTQLQSGSIVAAGYVSSNDDITVQLWTGSDWAALGNLGGTVYSMIVMPNGDLVVGGESLHTPTESFGALARWDGLAWHRMVLPGNWNGRAWGLMMSHGDLIVVGSFDGLTDLTRYGIPGKGWARWRPGQHEVPNLGSLSNQSVCQTGTAIFSVAVSSSSPLTYQWQWQPAGAGTAWVALAAGNNTNQEGVPAVHAADVGTSALAARPLAGYINFPPRAFRCVVTNSCGSVTSNEVTLTVCPADLNCDDGVDINDLLFFLSSFESGSFTADLDDGSSTGTPDGGIDINDLLFFLARFEAGC